MEIKMEYTDESGIKQLVSVANSHVVAIKATEAEKSETKPVVQPNTNEGSDNVMLMAISGCLILAIFIAIVVVLKKTR